MREVRAGSPRGATQKLASMPMLFGEIRQPTARYLAIPKTSLERRFYIPISFLNPDVVANTELFTLQSESLYMFGVLTSLMHMSWVRGVCGRLKSDYRYSAGIVYNNFPWPETPTAKQKQSIEAAAQRVLDVRTQFPDASLADLYDPLTMPAVLLKAHQALDKAVDAAYGKANFKTEAERVAFLFELYQKYISLLPMEKAKKAKKIRE